MKSISFSLVAIFYLLLVTSCDESSDGPGGAGGIGASALEVSGDDLGLLTINSGGKIVNLHVTNNGSSPVEDLQIKDPFYPLGFQGGVFPGTSGNCSAILAPQSSCSVALEIASWSSPGSYRQELQYSFTSNGTLHKKSVDIKAHFGDGKRLLTGNVTFGMVNVGRSKIKQLSLHNPSSFNDFVNVSLKLKSGSGFTLKNPGNCATIRPLDTCNIDIEFAPTASASLDETLTISYQVLGEKLSESVPIKATAHDIGHISSNGTHNFGAKVTNFNQPGSIKLTLARDAASFSDVSDITLGSLTGTGLSLDGATTCSNPGMILNSTNTCDFVFKTTIPIKTTTAINQNIEIKYKVGAVSKKTTLTLNGSLQIVPLRLHATSAHNFGTKAVAHAGYTLIKIVVENHSTSSIPTAQDFTLIGNTGGALALPLATGPGQTTCTNATNLANNGSTCQFVLRATPTASINNFSKNLTIKYKVGTEDITLPVTVQGNFNVLPPGFSGSPGIDIIGFAGHQNFGPVNVVAGDTFDISLTLTNTNATDIASTFQIERYNPAGTTIIPWPGSFIQYADDKSTCMTAGPLAAGTTCTIVLEITPIVGQAANLGVGQKFKVSYTDAGGHAHNQNVTVTGSWNFIPAPPIAPPWGENTNIPLIIDSTTAAHEYYSYVKRPVKPSTGLTAVLLNLFPQWAWNKIPTGTVKNVNHMVFTFETTPPLQVVKLKDIVPDRIVDTATGKRYVLMYHGSTSDTITGIFDQGSTSIRFDVATTTAYGMGFYLASNPNESKNYACDRRIGKGPHIQPILLIIGVQEDDAIKGRRSTHGGWGTTDLGTATGDPLDPNIYFRRTDTGHNQFVFYSNAKPYLRIFKIIKLAKNHGMSNGNRDGDGTPDPTPVGMTDPNTNPAYRCNW